MKNEISFIQKQGGGKNMKWIMGVLVMLMLVGLVSASEVTTDRLNFYDDELHTVNVTNTLSGSAEALITMPAGFKFVSSVSGCTNTSQIVNCSGISAGESAEFIMSSPISGTEYELYDLASTLNETDLNNVSFINIRDDEIFHTLVEYGRGRGNYFYDSMGTATSAGAGTGYRYVPNSTAFELNYLHKVYNIKQYFGLTDSSAIDVTFTCNYPVHTVVREHLASSITKGANEWTVVYSLPRIEGSWERMGFLGMDFDSGEYDVGDNFTINCTSLEYNLADAYGHIQIDEDSFYMQVRDPNPLSVIASSNPSTIGNGTSEVEITYTFTNDELYPLDSLQIAIQSPPDAQFIGVRGELWGTAVNSYLYELTSMASGQVESIVLVARFDTSFDNDISLELSQGILAKFVPTWELNAYNPMAYVQSMPMASTLTVNYATSSTITGLQEQIQRIETNTISINDTVNSIRLLTEEINSTTHTTSNNLLLINGTLVSEINSAETSILNLVNAVNATLYSQATSNFNSLTSGISNLSTQVSNFETTVQNLVNCTAAPTAPLCEKADILNTTMNNMYSDLLSINSTLYDEMNAINVSIMNELTTQFATIQSNFSQTQQLILDINASITGDISSLSSDVGDINTIVTDVQSTVNQISSDLLAINSTLVTKINNAETTIVNLINSHFANLSISTDEIMAELSYMQAFNEELIFLVTDSVGLAQEAQVKFDNGDTTGAITKLNDAAAKLEEANSYMKDLKKPIENNYKKQTTNSLLMKLFYSVKGLFL